MFFFYLQNLFQEAILYNLEILTKRLFFPHCNFVIWLSRDLNEQFVNTSTLNFFSLKIYGFIQIRVFSFRIKKVI